MGQHRITVQQIAAFESYLKREERSAGTIENYLRRVREFTAWLNGEEMDKERAGAWKLHLMSMGRALEQSTELWWRSISFLNFWGGRSVW